MSEPPQQPPQPPSHPGGPGEPPWRPDPTAQPPTGAYQPPPPSYPPDHPWAHPHQGSGAPGAYGYLPQRAVRTPNLRNRMGTRWIMRPEPRFGVSLAGAGMVLAMIGALVWSIGYLVSGLHVRLAENGIDAEGEGRKSLGAVLAIVVAVLGYLIMAVRKQGPLSTAGAIGAAAGVPIALGFLTLDFSGFAIPINIDVTYLVSILIWVVTYLLVPGARGRAFFLGLALISLSSYVEYKTNSNEFLHIAVSSTIGSGNGFGSSDVGAGGIAAIGLIFGLVYYAAAWLLDRRGLRGAAVAFVVAGLLTTTTGVFASAQPFGQVGTGVELIILGVALSWYGSRFGRRFTTWVWAPAAVAGIGIIVQKVLPHDITDAGIVLLIVGLLVVVVAALVASATNEPSDLALPEVHLPPPPTVAAPVPGSGFGGVHGGPGTPGPGGQN